MAATDVYPVPRKNAIYRLEFFMQDTSGAGVTGITPVVNISKDQAAPGAASGSVTEIGLGLYWVEFTATEMNADTIGVVITGTGAVTTAIILNPEESGDIRVNVTELSSNSVSASNLSGSAGSMLRGIVSYANFSANNTTFRCDNITEATPDHLNGRRGVWVESEAGTDALQFEMVTITGYSLISGEGTFTVTTMTDSPADNDELIIL